MFFMVPRSPLSQFLFDAFIEWEKEQPGKRSNYTKFAEYLGVKQQALNSWMNSRTTPNLESIEIIAKKLGPGIYSVLNMMGSDPDLQAVNAAWPNVPPEVRHSIREQAEQYVNENEPEKNRQRSETNQ